MPTDYFENFLSGLLCISDNLWLEYLHLNVKFNQHLLSLRCGLIIRLIWYIHLKHPVLKFSLSSTHIQVFFSCICILCPRREIQANIQSVVSCILESASLLRASRQGCSHSCGTGRAGARLDKASCPQKPVRANHNHWHLQPQRYWPLYSLSFEVIKQVSTNLINWHHIKYLLWLQWDEARYQWKGKWKIYKYVNILNNAKQATNKPQKKSQWKLENT